MYVFRNIVRSVPKFWKNYGMGRFTKTLDTMEIRIKKSTMVRPARETPKYCLQNSDLDLLVPTMYISLVYFYQQRPFDCCSNFFDAHLLKQALSNVLVPFYPTAGRLGKDGRIKCNGEGVLFLEAETSCVIDDLGDFSESLKLLQLFPNIDDAKDISSQPLVLSKVTHFKCGGVCLGVRIHHILGDATSMFHFINTWAEMTQGLPIGTPPFIDRTTLGCGVPISSTFRHIEYEPPPSLNAPALNTDSQSTLGPVSTAVFKLSPDQINTIKEKSKEDHGSIVKYSRTEVLGAHIWRCVCKARGLSNDQASKLLMLTNGRFRLNPPLPSGYLGNVVFPAASIALSGDIQSESLNDTVARIHEAIKRMDDAYLKSALAYLKQQPDLSVLKRGADSFKCPNLSITSLVHVPMYDANFGWGRPMFVRAVNAYFDGVALILPSAADDGSLFLVINLEADCMHLFKKFFHQIFPQCPDVRSRY